MIMEKFMSARQAVELIKDEDIVAVNGMGAIATPEAFFNALEERYLESQSPKNIGFYAPCGLGGRTERKNASLLSHPGLIGLMIIGHWDTYRHFFDAVNNNEIEAYNLPQGILSLNLHNAAAKRPGFLSKMGLKTFIDPRQDAGALNSISKRKFMELMTIDGKEYLFYKTIFPDVCVIRGTTADPRGNITFEKEALLLDPLATAQAVKNNKGKVIVQVERFSSAPANPKHVRIPGQLVDAVIVCPGQMQTDKEQYNPLYSGEIKAPDFMMEIHMNEILDRNINSEYKRSIADRIIARRAALELRDNDMINLGIGIPTLMGIEAYSMGILNDSITFTVESGTIGGTPVGDYAFGASMNADAIYTQAEQFEFYEGNALSISCVGALEIDKLGNVNVSKIGDKIFGIGGFNFVTQTPHRVVVCAKFNRGSGYNIDNGLLVPFDGFESKFCKQVESVSLSAEFAMEEKQEITYVTERAVFKLTNSGIKLTEIAPGLDIEKDVLQQMPFKPILDENIKIMPEICFNVQ